jgi:mRNA interferase RelE/StbE
MSYQVLVGPQVFDFASRLAPTPRHALKKAIIDLASEKGDLAALTDNLSGWNRLRVGRHRVIFRYQPGRKIECVFVEERRLVYELFAAELPRILGKKP